MIALVTVPWIVVGASYLWHLRGTSTAAATPVEPSAGSETTGDWGTLDVTPIVISPPLELVADDWARLPDAGRYWFFPGTTTEAAGAFLASTGLAADKVARLMATARQAPDIGGLVLTPDPELVAGLTPDVRAKIYAQLARSGLNSDQAQAFRYAADTVEAWLGPTRISPATRRLVEPLVFRHGRHLCFADSALARSHITDATELRRLAKALLRQPALRVRLSLGNPSDVPRLAEYWGRGGRRTDIRPLLESLADEGAGQSLDLVHLLPAFARDHLYRYPRITAKDLDRPALANCLWTALNFFNMTADDRYLDVTFAVDRLQQDYYIVQNTFELGDVVALLDEKGNIFHTVVYLADGLVFTKNGTSPLAPWIIVELDTVLDYYRLRSENPRLIYHRRKDL